MKNLRLKDFAYDLPKNLIAQEPVRPRDHSRLLVLDRRSGQIEHRHFYDLPDYLKPGDLVVLNDTKVMPARLIGRKAATGGKIEVFLLKKIRTNIWQCLIGGKKRKENLSVDFARGLKAEILKNNQDGASASLSAGTWQVKFNKSGAEFFELVKKIGRTPLPPYLASASSESVRKRQYQTVYADDRKLGSVAAPTAGFHFTKRLINQLKKKGVRFEYVTLRVGLGTFAQVKVDDITRHKMHVEYVEISHQVLANIARAKSEGRRVVAVGTTSARALESLFSTILNSHDASRNYAFWTDIFIYPGHEFKAVDGLITNFHLPKSTLLMLVSAFSGAGRIKKVYREAIKKKYRFYSYGDAMLIR